MRYLMMELDGVVRAPNPLHRMDIAIMKGVREKLFSEYNRGTRLIILSNVGEVAFGLLPKEDYNTLVRATGQMLGVPFYKSYLCYSHPSAFLNEWKKDSENRKPGTGMYKSFVEDVHFRKGVDELILIGGVEENRFSILIDSKFEEASAFFGW